MTRSDAREIVRRLSAQPVFKDCSKADLEDLANHRTGRASRRTGR